MIIAIRCLCQWFIYVVDHWKLFPSLFPAVAVYLSVPSIKRQKAGHNDLACVRVSKCVNNKDIL